MRLWTFQNKVVCNALQKYGVWYFTKRYSRRLKRVDEKYIQENVNTSQGVIDTVPIYCFASIKGYNHNLSLRTMYSEYFHIIKWIKSRLEEMVMIELEVPEDFILSSKKISDDTIRCNGTPLNDKCVHEDFIKEDSIELNNHLQFMRSVTEDDVECLIPYISVEHITAIRTLAYVNDAKDESRSGTCKIQTVYTGTDVPLWDIDIYCHSDGFPRVLKDDILIRGDITTISYMQCEYGMWLIYPYMTIKEIYACCNKGVLGVVREVMCERRLEYEDVKDLTYSQMFNDHSMEDDAALFVKIQESISYFELDIFGRPQPVFEKPVEEDYMVLGHGYPCTRISYGVFKVDTPFKINTDMWYFPNDDFIRCLLAKDDIIYYMLTWEGYMSMHEDSFPIKNVDSYFKYIN